MRYVSTAEQAKIAETFLELRDRSMWDALDVYRMLGDAPATCAIGGILDRFYLLTVLCKRVDAIHEWVYARTREVEEDPDNHLDLWAREHYKSTIITFAGVLQEILIDPEITVGIFSHTRPIAKAFLRQLKREMESNAELKAAYPDVLWPEPEGMAPTWSEDNGLVVRREGNPKESTVEAWGLVDGQPVSKHYALIVYDDIVTLSSVTTPEMIGKVTNAWELSRSLAAEEQDA